MIVDQRNAMAKVPFPGIDELTSVVKHEVKYQMSMWQQDYPEALGYAESVLGLLEDQSLRGYRALWEYLAGSAAILAVAEGSTQLNVKAHEHFGRAKKAARGIPWLVQLSQHCQTEKDDDDDQDDNNLVMLQVENIETVLSELGTMHDRKYSKREQSILEGLQDGTTFEEAHKSLGLHLGYDAGKIESEASPDPWWQIGTQCIVFEDHANANETSSLDAKKARQAASHPAWMKDKVLSCQSDDVEILPVLVTPVSTVYSGALPHLGSVSLWRLKDFNIWAYEAMATIRELRKTFVESGDIFWRVKAAEILQSKKMDVISLTSHLKTQIAKKLLIEKTSD